MARTKQRIGILGYGEVGKAIAALYPVAGAPYVFIEDTSSSPMHTFDDAQAYGGINILHVCIPYSSQFVAEVAKYIKQFAPGALIIIHSTVPVGTTEKVREAAGIVGIATVHSPVRGVHPDLTRGIKTFVKYIGADSPTAGAAAAAHFARLKIKAQVVHKSKTTELMKLLDTTYYGLCIAFHAYAEKLCVESDVFFERVMTDPNNTYNAGYTKLGKQGVVRPILYPPDGPIGGHCVIPNAALLKEQFGEDPLLAAILRHA